MNETKATQLIDKFFEGATTLSEEQQLYDYFTSPNVGPELMPVRQMFLDMCQLQGCEPTRLRRISYAVFCLKKKKKKEKRQRYSARIRH